MTQAKKALRALKALVKLQALARGLLVRKQTMEAVKCMHSLVSAQARAIRLRSPSTREPDFLQNGDIQLSYFRSLSSPHPARAIRLRSPSTREPDFLQNGDIQLSYFRSLSSPHPARAIRLRSPSTREPDFLQNGDIQLSYFRSLSSPHPAQMKALQSSNHGKFPNYMADTESSRARSQSVPKQRQSGDARMERSSSQVAVGRRRQLREGIDGGGYVKSSMASSSPYYRRFPEASYHWDSDQWGGIIPMELS